MSCDPTRRAGNASSTGVGLWPLGVPTREEPVTEIYELDAIGQRDLVRRGEVAHDDLVRHAIQRIEMLDPSINAVIHPRFEEALIECPADPGVLSFGGVPVLLRDIGQPSDAWRGEHARVYPSARSSMENTSPAVITIRTCLSCSSDSNGSPSTAMMSADLPGSRVP